MTAIERKSKLKNKNCDFLFVHWEANLADVLD